MIWSSTFSEFAAIILLQGVRLGLNRSLAIPSELAGATEFSGPHERDDWDR
jgi:hypothetical protein